MHAHLLAYTNGDLTADLGGYRRHTAAIAALTAHVEALHVPRRAVERPSPREASWISGFVRRRLLVMTCVGCDCRGFLDPPYPAEPERAPWPALLLPDFAFAGPAATDPDEVDFIAHRAHGETLPALCGLAPPLRTGWYLEPALTTARGAALCPECRRLAAGGPR